MRIGGASELRRFGFDQLARQPNCGVGFGANARAGVHDQCAKPRRKARRQHQQQQQGQARAQRQTIRQSRCLAGGRTSYFAREFFLRRRYFRSCASG